MSRVTSLLVVLAMAPPAFAQTNRVAASAPAPAAAAPQATDTTIAGPATEPKKPGPFIIGLDLGATFPQVFSKLNSHVLVALELGYRLPWIAQRLEVMFDVGYSPPGRSLDITRTEGTYKTNIVSQQLHFSLGPRFRVMPGTSAWNITIAVGPRLFLLQSSSKGSRDGQPFMEYNEHSTQIGFFAGVGGEYRLGPGAIFLDLSVAWAKMPHRIMGDAATGNSVSAGNLALAAGYRLFLPWW